MFSRIFGKKQSIYGNHGRFGQKNSSATRRIIQKPRYLYKESFYTNKPKPMASQSRVNRSRAHRSHKSRHTKHGKSRRLGMIMNNSPSPIMHKSRKNRSRY
jgi:hypothetical protein